MMTAFELAAKLKLDSAEFASGLGQSESAFQKFGDRIGKKSGLIKKIMGASVVAGAVMFTKKSINEGMEFDAAMSQVAATLGKTTAEMGELSAFARKMGSETAFSATEAAQALNYMALAGYSAEDSMRMLPTVLNLAAAGNFDLARASDMVTDAQSALGLSMEQTETLVDQMAKTSSKTNTSVEQLGDAILTVGGTAKSMRGGTKELSAVLGVLADNGIKGSEGGTALRNVLLSLTAPTDKAAKQLKKLGIEVYDSEGRMKVLPNILQDINKATSEMTQEERTQFLSEVFNKRDLKAIEALLGTSTDRWRELWKEIGGASGAASEMAHTQLDNLKGDLTIFKSALSEAMISISGKFTPALRKMTQLGTSSLTAITKAFNKNGLNGAIKAAGQELTSLGYIMSTSSNPLLKTLGNTINKISLDVRKWRVEVTDLPSALKYLSNIAIREFGNIKDIIGKSKIKIADFLGIDDADTATWYDIAAQAYTKIKDGFKYVADSAKVTAANLLGLTDENGNPLEWGDDISWLNIAKQALTKVKEKFKTFAADQKVKIADFLGIESPEDATWGDIALSIVKNIKAKLEDLGESAKILIADLLGFEDSEEVTWSSVGKKITEKIKEKIGDAKLKVAELLGFEEAEGVTWADIGKKITAKIKEKIGDAKLKVADLLGIEDSTDATWGTIGSKIRTGLLSGLEKLKIKAADLLGIEDAEDASWGDIVNKITKGLASHISKKGNLLKQLILGNEYVEGKSEWTDVGVKISGWIKEAFGEGGFIKALLGNAEEMAPALIEVAGTFVTSLSSWIKDNKGELTSIVSSFISVLGESTADLVSALIPVFTDSSLWESIGDSFVKVLKALIPENVWNFLFGSDGSNSGKGEEESNEPGKRKLHGTALDDDQIQSLINWRKAAQEGGSVITKNGETISVGKAFENVFKQTLETNGFSSEAIQQLWSESKNTTDQQFAAIMTDLANASTTFTDQFEADGTSLSESVNTATESVDALTVSADSNTESLDSLTQSSDSTVESADGLTESIDTLTESSDTFDESLTTASEDTDTLDESLGTFNDDLGTASEDLDTLSTAAAGAASALASVGGGDGEDDGSHAKGLWDVPYDDYVAKLHRGEMVLTASQARQYRDGGSGLFDFGALKDAIVSAVRQGISGAQVNSYIDGKSITDEVSRVLGNALSARRFA